MAKPNNAEFKCSVHCSEALKKVANYCQNVSIQKNKDGKSLLFWFL